MFGLEDVKEFSTTAEYFDVRLTFRLPEIPITWEGTPELKLHAEALTDAIKKGIITEPGMYRIYVIKHPLFWNTVRMFNYEIHKFDETVPDDEDDPAYD